MPRPLSAADSLLDFHHLYGLQRAKPKPLVRRENEFVFRKIRVREKTAGGGKAMGGFDAAQDERR